MSTGTNALLAYGRNITTNVNPFAASGELAARGGAEVMPAWGRTLERRTDPESFPALHAALQSEAFARDDEPDDEFVFGLERVLDGVAALVHRRARGEPCSEPVV